MSTACAICGNVQLCLIHAQQPRSIGGCAIQANGLRGLHQVHRRDLRLALRRIKKPRHKGGAKVSVINAVPQVEGAVTLAVFECRVGLRLAFLP